MLLPRKATADPEQVLTEEEKRRLIDAKKVWWQLQNAYEAKLAELARRENRTVAEIRAEAEA